MIVAASLLPIADIMVGTRHRREMGDIAGLAASMAELGLLQPIVVRPDGTLIAGERRLRAAEQLGWTHIPVSVVDLDAVVRGEFAENAVRKIEYLTRTHSWDGDDPVVIALRSAARAVGQQLANRLTFAELHDLVEKIAFRVERREGARLSRLCYALDGARTADGERWLA